MPKKPPNPCGAPKCPELTYAQFCDAHTEQYWLELLNKQNLPPDYGSAARWKKAKNIFLLERKSCSNCERAATDVAHVIPHRGSTQLFWTQENWAPLCHKHYRNKSLHDDMSSTILDLVYPLDLKPAAIPLTLVHGASGSGKTTWVREQAAPGDMIIDLDVIMASVSEAPLYAATARWLEPSLIRRNNLLRSLAIKQDGRAWYIVCAPKRAERWYWANMLRPQQVKIMETPLTECERRLRNDASRQNAEMYVQLARAWWNTYCAERPGDA
ncbi:MAG TPA: AAA family ATPase [Dissulfurispiraceae bacterium]|nr:AAA family ATPase [Dissulfurispiraceae bacterium]